MLRWTGGTLVRKVLSRHCLASLCVVGLAIITTSLLLAGTFNIKQVSHAYTRGRQIFSGWFRSGDNGFFCSTEEIAESVQHQEKCSSALKDWIQSYFIQAHAHSFEGLPILSLGTDSVLGSSADRCLTYDARYTTPESCSSGSELCHDNVLQAQHSQDRRTAIVLRAWDGFQWTSEDARNVQAMISEVSLLGDDYAIHILLHVTNRTQGQGSEAAISQYIPTAFTNITELWTYEDCQMAYPSVGEYDFYYHAFMALQLFADRHPEYDFFWNWEMDARYTGHYDHFFTSVTDWANNQSRDSLWQRNTRFYIPPFHGSYEDFTASAALADTDFPAPKPWVEDHFWRTASNTETEADLITLFPMFDVSNTIWPHRDYVINYTLSGISRFGTVGTNTRLSRALLQLMSHENKAGRAMMTEMFPPTLAFHHNLKAVAVPHPIYFDKQWSKTDLQKTFNGGVHGRVGGAWTSVINQEHYFLRSTWFWNARLPLKVYQRWLDGRGSAESEALCLPPMLLHPVKSQHFNA